MAKEKVWKLISVIILVLFVVVGLGFGYLWYDVSTKLNDTKVALSESYAKPFSNIDSLNTWIETQPTIQNPGFVVPNSDIDIKNNKIKGLETSQNAFAIQQSAARDGYLVSVHPVNLGENFYVSINIAILENGDVYAFGTDGDEPTFWFNIYEDN